MLTISRVAVFRSCFAFLVIPFHLLTTTSPWPPSIHPSLNSSASISTIFSPCHLSFISSNHQSSRVSINQPQLSSSQHPFSLYSNFLYPFPISHWTPQPRKHPLSLQVSLSHPKPAFYQNEPPTRPFPLSKPHNPIQSSPASLSLPLLLPPTQSPHRRRPARRPRQG